MRNLFGNKLTRNVMILSAILIVLFGFTVYKDSKTLIESGAGAALNPVQKVLYSANKRVENFIDFYLRYETVKADNETLLKENIELNEKLRNYDILVEENKSLTEMFSFKNRRNEYNYVGANIIGNSGGGIITSYTIDIGSKDGVKKGMAVMTPDGIVGQVTDVALTYSLVETLSSENVSIHVTTVENAENTGILVGYQGADKKQMAKINYLPIDSSIKEGDSIVTSGLGKFYPPNIFVGTVTKIIEDKGNLMKTAIIETKVNFKGIQSLYIIIPKDSESVEY